MKIRKVSVSGFKNIKQTELVLDTVTAILSPNNYGKSNLLEAVRFGIDFISADEKKRKAMMSWIKGIPINTALENSEFSFEIEFENVDLGEYRYVKYGFSFIWYRDDGNGQRITNEWIESRPTESVKYSAFLKRNECKYRKEKDTTSFRNINLTDTKLAIDTLAEVDDIAIQPMIKEIKNIDYRICSSLDLRDRFQFDPIEYVDYDKDENIYFDDRDVPRALYKLQKTDEEKYNLFLEAIYTLFPDFLDINIQSYTVKHKNPEINIAIVKEENEAKEPTPEISEDVPFRIKDELYRIYIKSKYMNQPIDVSRMSTGTKRIFWLLANVFIASSKRISFIGVEELETSIHPKLLKGLLEFLDEALESTSLIISSHSPFLAQYIKPDNMYIGKPTDDGTATFKKVKQGKIKTLIKLARDNDMAVGEYLFELMSGGNDREELLSFYLEN